jgi:cytochrome c-type biogenesis protein CcmH/NrfG
VISFLSMPRSSRLLFVAFMATSVFCSASSFAAKPRRPNRNRRKRQARSAGGISQVAAKGRGSSSGSGSSLEAMLGRQHEEQCAAAAQKYGVWPSDDSIGHGTYDGDWDATLLSDNFVSPQNFPYNSNRLLVKSRAPLLSEAQCQAWITLTEQQAEENGWDQRYPIAGYTQECNVQDFAPELLSEQLRDTLLPAVCTQFPSIEQSTLRVYNAQVVKYSHATGANCLPVHQDFAILTLNVALSDEDDFESGGTWIQPTGETIRARRGEALVHAGRIPHSGVPVSRGVRYQLVVFLMSTSHVDLGGRLQAVGAAAGAKRFDGSSEQRRRAAKAAGGVTDVALSSKALSLSLKANPRDAETWSQLAHNQWHDGDLAAAARSLAMVLELSGRRDFAALADAAAVSRARERPAEALELLQEALILGAPPSPTAADEAVEVQFNAALTLMEMRQHEDAGLILESLVKADPDAADAWSALGVCLAALGQPDAALVCQREVVRIRDERAAARLASLIPDSSSSTSGSSTDL